MSKVCEISGKKPMTGNNVSHANNRTKRRFIPNLQNVKLYSGTLQKYINLNITIRTMKSVEKNGIVVEKNNKKNDVFFNDIKSAKIKVSFD